MTGADQIKIGYTIPSLTPAGYWNTEIAAYVSAEPDERGWHHGTSKHTGLRIAVTWNAKSERWELVWNEPTDEWLLREGR